MPIKEGWELSSDRDGMYEKIMESDPVGDPIITSKCTLGKEHGLLIASNNGFAWRIKMGFSTSLYSAGKSKWVRWHDIANITPKKPGQVLLNLKLRKNGALVMKKGRPKEIRWKLTIDRNKDEPKELFLQRRETFYDILMELFNQNKGETDPASSDSRM